MIHPVPITEIWRGPLAESVHLGHAIVCGPGGAIREVWGDPNVTVYPRSSSKMIQALPLVESGAAAARGLTPAHLALACASHNGAAMHTERVAGWLDDLGLGEGDLRCGAHEPFGVSAHHALIRAGGTPCRLHNNCSGKHAGFLTLGQHLGAGPDYIAIDHPVQRACMAVFEEVTDQASPGYGIDGCSAPNPLTTLPGMGRAMAAFACAEDGADARQSAMVQLWQAMVAHPDLVAGEGRGCTELMRACSQPVALKTGAEGFYIAIIPGQKLGVALKIADGATRGAECAIAALLIRLGVLEADHPAARKYCNAPIVNCGGLRTGMIKPAASLL